jgi:hypothetical protein
MDASRRPAPLAHLPAPAPVTRRSDKELACTQGRGRDLWEAARHVGLSRKAFEILMGLAFYAHVDDGIARCSLRGLARAGAIHEGQAGLCMKELVAAGLVEILPDPDRADRCWYLVPLMAPRQRFSGLWIVD